MVAGTSCHRIVSINQHIPASAPPADEPPTELQTVVVAGPDGAPAPGSGEPLPPGSRIGPYRIIAELGRGGMGEVYLAEQLEPVQRQVALKLLPDSAAGQRERLTWFTIEAQMLANMQHPGIAQMFDAGVTESGRPWLAMEYVDGQPLLAFCRERGLDLQARLRLFIRLCQGAQHAHQKGFVHRDLKPANILVATIDGRAQPKIIDFGIATATRRAMGGASALPSAGTPRYMSPEQAKADTDLDARSDVYALGAILFELALDLAESAQSGYLSRQHHDANARTVKPSASFAALGAAGQRELAVALGLSPRALARRLREDLDWIVERAVAEDRERRYPSAAALADDVERLLNLYPVEAAPSSSAYRLRRFIARHRFGVAASTAVALALVLGLTAAISGFIQASAERDRAESALALAEAVNGFLVEDLLAAADLEVAAEGSELTVRETLERARQRAGERFADEPAIEAGVREALAISLRGLGQHQTAEEEFRRVLALREAALGASHPDTLRSGKELASVIHHLGRFDEAEPLYEASLAGQLATLGPGHPDSIASLNGLAILDWQRGRMDSALVRGEQAVALAREQLGPLHRETLGAVNNLARVYRALGRIDEAETLGLEAIAGRTQLFGPDALQTLESRNDLAGLYRGSGRLDEAAREYEAVLETYLRVAGPDHSGAVIAMNNLARTYGNQGRHAEAIELYRRALSHGPNAMPEDSWVLAMLSMNLAEMLILEGEPNEARERLLAAEQRLSALFADDDPRVLRSRQLLREIGED